MPSPLSRVGTAAITENMLKRRWSTTILRYLYKGTYHPSEILKSESLLSPKVLSERLRTMHRYGLVARFPSSTSAQIAEYRLTAFGKKILEMLNAIEQLDRQFMPARPMDAALDINPGLTPPSAPEGIDKSIEDKPRKKSSLG